MRMRVTICVNSAVRPLRGSEQVQHNITQHRSGDSSFDSEFCLLITTLPFIASEVRGRDRGPPRGSSWWKRVFPWERRSRLRPSSPSSGVWRSVSAGSRREIPPRSSALTRSSTWERGWRKPERLLGHRRRGGRGGRKCENWGSTGRSDGWGFVRPLYLW